MKSRLKGFVSVIIPAFNRRRYIEEAVLSVITQDYDEVECIVVDDGSSDGTYEALMAIESSRLRVLCHPERDNKGQSASLNLGLKHVRGEFVAILDSDDLFLPGKLRKQVGYLNDHPEVGLVYGMGQAINEHGDVLYDILSEDHVEPNDPNEVLLDCYFLLPQNAMVRRSVYDDAGFFEESFRAAQDHDMLIRIAEVTRFGFLPQKLFQYRRHADSISNNGQERRWKTGFEILKRARARYPYRRSTLRKRAAVLNFRLGQTYLKKGETLKAIPYLLKSGFLDPARSIRVISGREGIR